MAPQKIVDDRGHIASAEQDGSGYREIAPQLGLAGDQSFFRLVRGGQNDATAFKILRPPPR
jgi:hypothetical protein